MADQDVADLGQEAFDRYLHMYRKGQLNRREFMRIAVTMALSGIGAAGLGGCSPATPASPATTKAAATSPAATSQVGAGTTVQPTVVQAASSKAAKDTISTCFDFDMPSLDPQMATLGELTMINMTLFDTLVQREVPSMKLVPGLATSFKPIEPTVWELELRQGVTFQNGEPFDGESVKYTFERVLDPATKSPQRGYHQLVTGVDVISPYKVHVKTSAPHPIFLLRAVQLQMLPPKYYKEKGPGYVAEHPVGSGPYKFTEWQHNQYIAVEKWNGYWGKPGYFNKVLFRDIPEKATQMAELLAGRLDVIRGLPMDQMKAVDASGVAKTVVTGSPVVGFVILDVAGKTGKNPFQDKRVRQAANYALPIDDYIKKLQPGGIRTPAAYWTKGFAADPNVKPYEYDPDQAKKLLADAGYPNGFDARFLISTAQVGPNASLVYQAMQQDWLKVGIKTDNQIMEHNALTDLAIGGKAGPMYMWNWASEFDPEMVYSMFLTSKGIYSYINDPEMDKLVKEGGTSMDSEFRAKVYSQVQQKVRDEAYYIFLWNWAQIYGVNKGIVFDPLPEDMYERYAMFKPA